MADYLVVHVISADVPTSSNASTASYFVKLQYNGQTRTTSVKENVPIWDERICFHRKAQLDHSGELTLEAQVYNSSSLLGTVLLSDRDFCRHSDKVVSIRRQWKDNGGELVLKAFLAGAVEVQPFLAGAVEVQPFLVGADEVEVNIFNNIFGTTKDRAIATGLGDAVPKMINPDFEDDRLIERMRHLFVRVVKARRLPDVDANGNLDPYVEVTFGAYNKGVTKCLKRNKNPEWNETFAFSFQQYGKTPSPSVYIVVNDKDLVKDDFVGKLDFNVQEIQERLPDDKPLEPTWYLLRGEDGEPLAHASLLVAVWIGSQSDEAYRHAWVSEYSPKVYDTPRLWCLRVTILEVQGIAVGNATEVFCKACLGDLVQKTRIAKTQMTSRGCCAWNEDLLFVAAEPFFEGALKVSVIAHLGTDEAIGTLTIPLASIGKRCYDDHLISPNWFPLEKPGVPQLDGSVDDFNGNTSMKICLRNFLEGGYNIGHDHQGYIDDTRPTDRKLWSPPIGSVHLGILRTIGLTCGDGSDRRLTLNPYCVAKYGDKWIRTRTLINAADHALFNEQYTWDVYDIATWLNIGVFDHCMVEGSGHRKIGNVRIHLSCLETDRRYAHSYLLVVLSPSGAKKAGELQLAVKISLPSSTQTLRMYARPTLPKMHYVQPLTDVKQYFFWKRDVEKDKFRSQAVKIMAHRLGRVEPPLRSEVVDSMFHTEGYNLWSMRKTKANFFRLMGVVAPLIAFFTWFGNVRSWRHPAVTLLAHAIFVLALWFHKLVTPLVPLCAAFVAIWNYRFRPSCPPYANFSLSLLDMVHPDEIEEEFDTIKTSCTEDLVRMRYDRLRFIAGRVQTVIGDMASLGEKIQSLVNWRDPTATAIFYSFVTMIAVMLYFVPFKVLMAVAWFYIMRHPRFRTNTASVFSSFIQRLPSKQDLLL